MENEAKDMVGKQAGTGDQDLAPDDLANLPQLNDEAVLEGIKQRFHGKQIYTRINSLLIAMNPYQQLPIYSTEMMAQHKGAPIGALAPHVFSVAAAAYYGLLGARSQVPL